jgi:hypothetical protein
VLRIASTIFHIGHDIRAMRRYETMCGRPLGFKSIEENSDAWVECDHVSGLT